MDMSTIRRRAFLGLISVPFIGESLMKTAIADSPKYDDAPLLHIANSAGILLHAGASHDQVLRFIDDAAVIRGWSGTLGRAKTAHGYVIFKQDVTYLVFKHTDGRYRVKRAVVFPATVNQQSLMDVYYHVGASPERINS